jgi:ubiquinone biosynthesis O-methyltransferase
MAGIDPNVYARWRGTQLGAVTERLEQAVVFDLAGPLAGKRVLDVGCGDGAYSIEAAKRGAVVTGIDTSVEMLAAARRRAEEAGVRIAFVEGDARKVPFADGSFDIVLAVTVLCFVRDADLAVREMTRVLVPGGHLVLADLGKRSLWAAERRVRSWFGSTSWRAAHFRTARELHRLIERAGLSVERTRGSIYYPPLGTLARWMAWLDRVLCGRAQP